jgi:pyridoxine kinase
MQVSHNNQKKIAVINDYSGFGRCSIAVAMPIISVMKVQCCPVPTSVFSNHTGFDSYYYEDFTDSMTPYIDEWRKLGLKFSGISTGFLGSKRQIDIVLDFLKDFDSPDTQVVIDPVMGDYGKPYPTYTEEMCQEMKKLVKYADILTPNITEACILTDTSYKENWDINELEKMAAALSKKSYSPDAKVVITGIPRGSFLANLCYEAGETKIIKTKKIGESRSGTGDVFSAILAADAVNGVSFIESVKKATDFIRECIQKSVDMELPLTDGVCFEEFLYKLGQ